MKIRTPSPRARRPFQVRTPDGELLSRIKHHMGFLAQRLGSISALAFHPHELILAAGATDSIVSIFSPEDWKPQDSGGF